MRFFQDVVDNPKVASPRIIFCRKSPKYTILKLSTIFEVIFQNRMSSLRSLPIT